jgi:hypothetical protein
LFGPKPTNCTKADKDFEKNNPQAFDNKMPFMFHVCEK